MSVTRIDLDDELLPDLMRLSGTKTKKDAVNVALREYVMRRRRADAGEKLFALVRSWDYEAWKRQREAEKIDPLASKRGKSATRDTAA